MNTNSSHEDILLNSIWIEMKQANTNKYYSELLIDQDKKLSIRTWQRNIFRFNTTLRK